MTNQIKNKKGEVIFTYEEEDLNQADLSGANLSGADCMVFTPVIKNAFKYDEPDMMGSIYYPSGANNSSWGLYIIYHAQLISFVSALGVNLLKRKDI